MCLGRVMVASLPTVEGAEALGLILRLERGAYRFTRHFEPREEGTLNTWVSDYLRQRRRAGETTEKLRRPPPPQRP